MNTILILIDSVNRHFLQVYSDTHVQTPNLTRFAEKSWRFDKHYVGSLPCMPARREIFSGTKEMLWRPWGSLEFFDHRLPKLIEKHGSTTAIVTDHYHYWEEAANGYIQSFQSSNLVRGHEIDNWQPPVASEDNVPKWVSNIEKWRPDSFARQYYANVKNFQTQDDFFPAKVFNGAVDWLQHHSQQHKPFFLQIESFDVHEPFHVPEPYLSMYCEAGLDDLYTLWPPYQNITYMQEFFEQTTEAELDFIRAMYASKLTMVDRWFGELLTTFDHYHLWDDTMIIITTDHGHDLGEFERQIFGKHYPHWDSHANIPMFVWHPEYPNTGQTISEFTQTIDLFASILDNMSIPIPADKSILSRSFLPLLQGDNSQARQGISYGTFGQGVCVTNGDWTLFQSPTEGKDLFMYSSQIFQSLVSGEAPRQPIDQGHFIPHIEFPQWKIPIKMNPMTHEHYLFDMNNDPQQQHNLYTKNTQERKIMLDLLHHLITEEGAPPEQYRRLGLKQ